MTLEKASADNGTKLRSSRIHVAPRVNMNQTSVSKSNCCLSVGRVALLTQIPGGDGGLFCLVDAPFVNSVDWCAVVQSTVASTDEASSRPDVRIIQRYANCADGTFYPNDAPEQSEAWKIAYGSGNDVVKTC